MGYTEFRNLLRPVIAALGAGKFVLPARPSDLTVGQGEIWRRLIEYEALHDIKGASEMLDRYMRNKLTHPKHTANGLKFKQEMYDEAH